MLYLVGKGENRMNNLFKSIGDFLYAVVNLLINMISGIVQMLTMIPAALTMLTNSVAFMPTILIAFAIGLITVSIVYLIVGR